MENETDQNESNELTTQENKTAQAEVLSSDECVLISETIDSIKEIFDKCATNTYIEVGVLLLEKIYDNKIELIDFTDTPDKDKLNKQKIFKHLARDITSKSKTGESLPAKTFLYNSIKLVKDQVLLSDCEEYKSLSISHKIELLSVESKEEKINITQEISRERLSVRSTRELVYKENQAADQDIVYFIKNLDKIGDLEAFMGEQIDQLVSGNTKIKSAKTACSNQLKHANARIESIENEIEKHKKNINKLEVLLKYLEEKASAKSDKRKKVKAENN